MEDFYIEQIVEKKKTVFERYAKTLWLLLTVGLLGFGTFAGNAIVLILGFAVGFGGYYFFLPTLSVEFEYLYMSKELSVDKIFDKQKRKKFKSWDLTNMEMMAPATSDRLKAYDHRQFELVNVSSGIEEHRRFVIIINDKVCTRLLFEPNDELLKAISDQFPRKVFMD